MRRAAKVDIAQPAIVKGLRDAGYWVEIIQRPVDLMVGRTGRKGIVLLEVKNDDSDRFTPGQIQFFRQADGTCVARVHTLADALAVVSTELGEGNGGKSEIGD